MSAAIVITAPGWYGKLPAIGDFASRRLPVSFIEPWDTWLQQSLLASRAALGADWLDCFLNAPIRRFALGAAVLGEGAWVGIMLPSVDRIGRHFPLTIAAGLGRDSMLPAESALAAWFERIEAVALAALDLDAPLEAVDVGLIDEPLPAGSPMRAAMASMDTLWWVGSSGTRLDERVFQGLPPPTEFAGLLGARLA